ncbi:hypothetical protein M758_11G067100 [Ceratodon purpureus]|nr:hypothetical protein M758_11G067100 [Ceratodon purpureus]
MESQDEDVVRGVERKQMQVNGTEVASSSFEVGLDVDRRPNLSALQAATSEPEVVTRPTASSSHLPPLPATKPGKVSASHGQLPPHGPRLRSRASIEKNLNTVLTVAQRGSSESSQPGLPPPSSLWNKRTSSLPVRTNAHNPGSNPDSNKGHSPESGTYVHCEPGYQKVNIVRSFSTPVFVNKLESFRKDGSDRKGFVLLRLASPRIHRVQPSLENESARAINHHTSPQFDAEKGKGDIEEEEEETISEEEAVCRICMDSLTEEFGETLKMECCCLGEMALAHKECAFKWFGIKGDRVCEVCGSVVNNIPVTVVRFPAQETTIHVQSTESQPVNRASVWKDILFMGVINMLAYFCFIEQLLVYKLGAKALAISIPFSVIIGFLSSVTTIALVRRRYIWLYAFIQFSLLCFFGVVFFFKTRLEPVLAIPLAAFLSFVIAMTSNALILEYIHWKQCSFSRLQSSTSSMSVDASSRQETSSELATSQGSRELDSLQTSREFDIESGSANSRSPNFRRQAASEGHFMHYS